jgi:hypothetical protein
MMNGDTYYLQIRNPGRYNFGSVYVIPENYTSVTLDSKGYIEANKRGTIVDLMIYSMW